MKLRIDLKIFIFLILFYFTKQIEIYGFIMFFCIIHELGHIFAGILLKMKPQSVELMPWGLSVQFKLFPKDYNEKVLKSNKLELKKLLIAMAGPIVNCILIILFINIKIKYQDIIVYSNMIILIFNLIPIYPLDGGRILKSIFKITKGNVKAEKISNVINNSLIIILTFLLGFTIYIFKNISIIIILIYLWYLVIKENNKYKIKLRIYKVILQNKE